MENDKFGRFEQNPSSDSWDMSDVEFAGDASTAENNEKERPPEHVYRGIVVSHDAFSKLDFEDDLVPDKPPEIDDQGREIIGDGNEYGVYLTDYDQMAKDVYGNPENKRGKTLAKLKGMFGETTEVSEPMIGVVYKINTEGTDIHEPWICAEMNGHYNNGYSGKEWVSSRIPREQYEIELISLSSDILHDKESFSGASKEDVEARYAERMAHLERLCSDLGDSLPKEMRGMTTFELKKHLKSVYGDNGTAYLN